MLGEATSAGSTYRYFMSPPKEDFINATHRVDILLSHRAVVGFSCETGTNGHKTTTFEFKPCLSE